ncbi:MAG: type II toxin-antitoxin system antitoxin SocA domain-containing protein [Dyadobacter sp.]|uniref:Panacea domain-containing protein n=1 Tax=Dyadobacter sp. TaxID=1914288 RepID=UPI003263360C
MSHLKLQKLLYYTQAYHLAYFKNPLIDDDFEAWVHGPVSRKVFDLLKDKSLLYVDLKYTAEENNQSPVEHVQSSLTREQFDWVNYVLGEFSTLTGPELEALTHSEAPWIDARKGFGPADRCNNIISKPAMAEYYRQQLY